mmetsp:Transcript_21751/g.38992  ORF Transcript_21751/g.38992 Transcript_21751/m.38992 type:complete len:334 (+) Transcript_21751:146-1147(+)|eukprot:CAMPEP_0197621046 /NCGR_PEP_ID=MMETSP1338-20131121/1692_1 /TAXON_ID=43686 ORGANISM="Pelagodinium beii, Strain RCC1491" /NCGR_SAMPLE_ID=MMETSP1338 /ASSEMBLY_ACC=CAM_ASM_000754 /LENGTH=333 /DNA_ID=CAMNT_0043190373 /DNA_START=122 /DNA_END=1123 /DNA_ORIENTATION=-
MVGTSISERIASGGEALVAGTSFCFCSVGMLLFNKFAIKAFPYECTLVAMQMIFAAVMLVIFGWSSLHVGSAKDLLRWCMVVPFFTGMLLSSILALKVAPMSLVVTLRCLSPLGALAVERFYPNPGEISSEVIISILVMFAGGFMYVSQVTDQSHFQGIGWVFLNSMIAIMDRCLQRYLLAKDQNPVDISKTGVTLINNAFGAIPMVIAAYLTGEFDPASAALAQLGKLDMLYVAMSCVIGLGISYCGIWAQSLISATSFLVMINANKFIIIGIEASPMMQSKSLNYTQIMGACITILGACLYGKARQALESDQAAKRLLENNNQEQSAGKTV